VLLHRFEVEARQLLISILRPFWRVSPKKTFAVSTRLFDPQFRSPLPEHLSEFERIDWRCALLVIIEKHKYVASLRFPGLYALCPSI
jgi:hypothetical protein